MTASTRLGLVAVILLSATLYMAWAGASSSWRYYLTVDEALAVDPSSAHVPVRVSGTVVANSLTISDDGQQAEFQLAGSGGNLHVTYAGQVPLNLAESKQVVVEGVVSERCVIQADQVLTRCSSKYSAQSIETARLPDDCAVDRESGIVR